MSTGPYFPDQPETDVGCGCYYPDLMRAWDVWVDGGTILRVCMCVHHGESEFPIAEVPCGHYQAGVKIRPAFADRAEFLRKRREHLEEFRADYPEFYAERGLTDAEMFDVV